MKSSSILAPDSLWNEIQTGEPPPGADQNLVLWAKAFLLHLLLLLAERFLVKMNSKLALRVTAYLFYVLVVASVLFLYRFPYARLQHKLEAFVAARLDLRLDLTDLRLALPLRFDFSRCVLRRSGGQGEPIVEIENGHFRPAILPFLRGKIAVTIRAKAYGGGFDGVVLLQPIDDLQRYQLQANWHDIRLEQHPGLSSLIRGEMSGKISGEVQMDGSLKERAEASGFGKLKLTEGVCPINTPYLKIRTLEGLEVNAAVKLIGGKLEISNCEFSAEGIRGTLSGEVKLQSEISGSTLSLAGQGHIDGSMLKLNSGASGAVSALFNKDKPLPFRVQGTLAQPELKLLL